MRRSQIAIPAQGMIEFRDALTDLLDEFGVSDGGREDEKTSGNIPRSSQSSIVFDCRYPSNAISDDITFIQSFLNSGYWKSIPIE